MSCGIKARSGSKSPHWKGDDVTENAGRVRAIREFPIDGEVCEVCGEDARVRHHRDENVTNNASENIRFLCYKCHVRAHIESTRAAAKRRYEELRSRNGEGARDAELIERYRRLEGVTYEQTAEALGKTVGWVYTRCTQRILPTVAETEMLLSALTNLAAEG